MTVTLNREPSRADLFTSQVFDGEECTCDERLKALADSRYALAELFSSLCKSCKARMRWNELLKVVDD